MRILFIHKQVLFPHDTGGKIRALNVLRHLAKSHDVTYLCNLRPGEEEGVKKMEALGLKVETTPARESRRGSPAFYLDLLTNLASPYAFTIARNFDPAMRERARQIHAREPFDLVICDCVQMARNGEGLKGPATIVFQHNVEAQILKRAAGRGSLPMRAYMALQWKKMHRFESKVGRSFDLVIAISEPDKAIFEHDYGWNHVAAIDTAVDTDYFRPDAVEAVEDPRRVVFVGSMDWFPNQQAIRYFAKDVWPIVRKARPDATLQVVGRTPPADIEALSGQDGIEVVGKVPDTRPYIAEAAVSIVPILVGGGTRLKIFEAMAMRKAVVSTTIGAEGLPLTPGEHILLADTPETFAADILSMLNDRERRDRLAQSAYDLVHSRYRSDLIAKQFEDLCIQAVDKHRQMSK